MQEHVFLNISPISGMMIFEKSGKLCARYVGPFEIKRKEGVVAYQLALLQALTLAYDVFHISMLKKYILDVSHKMDLSELEFMTTYLILKNPHDSRHQGNGTKDKDYPFSHTLEEVTSKVEIHMRANYQDLFPQLNFGTKFSLRRIEYNTWNFCQYYIACFLSLEQLQSQ